MSTKIGGTKKKSSDTAAGMSNSIAQKPEGANIAPAPRLPRMDASQAASPVSRLRRKEPYPSPCWARAGRRNGLAGTESIRTPYAAVQIARVRDFLPAAQTGGCDGDGAGCEPHPLHPVGLWSPCRSGPSREAGGAARATSRRQGTARDPRRRPQPDQFASANRLWVCARARIRASKELRASSTFGFREKDCAHCFTCSI